MTLCINSKTQLERTLLSWTLGYNEQNIQSQMAIYYTNQPGYNEPQL